MLQLSKIYRKDYQGEDIISEKTYTDGIWDMVMETVPNNVINNQISNRAVVWGNGLGRNDFDVGYILKRKSGLLGADALQSYACNAFYRDYTPDFLVVTDRRIAKETIDSGFVNSNVVYTRVDIALEFPKKFYLIPHDPYGDAGTMALYIAAFDGHKRIYMCGFDNQPDAGINNNVYVGTMNYDPRQFGINDDKWIDNKQELFNTYDDVDFVYVTRYGYGKEYFPEKWKSCVNLRHISYRDWVLEADL
jgi:hypothetical protein